MILQNETFFPPGIQISFCGSSALRPWFPPLTLRELVWLPAGWGNNTREWIPLNVLTARYACGTCYFCSLPLASTESPGPSSLEERLETQPSVDGLHTYLELCHYRREEDHVGEKYAIYDLHFTNEETCPESHS